MWWAGCSILQAGKMGLSFGEHWPSLLGSLLYFTLMHTFVFCLNGWTLRFKQRSAGLLLCYPTQHFDRLITPICKSGGVTEKPNKTASSSFSGETWKGQETYSTFARTVDLLSSDLLSWQAKEMKLLWPFQPSIFLFQEANGRVETLQKKRFGNNCFVAILQCQELPLLNWQI